MDRLPAAGTTLGAVMAGLPEGVQVAGVRKEHHNRLPDPSIELEPGDALLVASDRTEGIEATVAALGRLEPGRIAGDRGRPFLSALPRLQGRSDGQAARRSAGTARRARPLTCTCGATTWT